MVTCKKCGMKYKEAREPDPCLGMIPGVTWACCGHGKAEKAYVVIGLPSETPIWGNEYGKDFLMLRRQDALNYFKLVIKAKTDKKEIEFYKDYKNT